MTYHMTTPDISVSMGTMSQNRHLFDPTPELARFCKQKQGANISTRQGDKMSVSSDWSLIELD